jgi:putative Mn2+ efflux pump MntP
MIENLEKTSLRMGTCTLCLTGYAFGMGTATGSDVVQHKIGFCGGILVFIIRFKRTTFSVRSCTIRL